jgi:hypothetical protein
VKNNKSEARRQNCLYNDTTRTQTSHKRKNITVLWYHATNGEPNYPLSFNRIRIIIILLVYYRSKPIMDTGVTDRYLQLSILTSYRVGSKPTWISDSAKNSGKLNDLECVYPRDRDLTLKTRRSYKRSTRIDFYEIIIIPHKSPKKGGFNKFIRDVITNLRTSYL